MFSLSCYWILIDYRFPAALKEEQFMFFTQQEIYGGEERKFGYPMAWNENLVKGTQ